MNAFATCLIFAGFGIILLAISIGGIRIFDAYFDFMDWISDRRETDA